MDRFWLKLIAVLFFMLLSLSYNRLIFVLLEYFNGFKISFTAASKAMAYGLYMDFSVWSIEVAAILIGLVFVSMFKKVYVKNVINTLGFTFLALNSIVYAIDSVLYPEWGFRIDYTFFTYLDRTNEGIHFISIETISKFIIAVLLFNLPIAFFYFLRVKNTSGPKFGIITFISIFLSLGILVIPLRGGVGLSPLNPGTVYHSKDMYANHIALHPIWNILYTYSHNKSISPKRELINPVLADSLFKELNFKGVANDKFIDSERPNMLFLLLESFTANMINQSHAWKEILPGLNRWIKKGVYFDQVYASGDRTDKGLAAIYSAYPAQPQSSIIKIPSKAERLPSLSKTLAKYQYNCSFFYGGDIDFAGMKTYLLASGIDRIISKKDFNPNTYNAKWGVHDHILLDRVRKDIYFEKSPFLMSVLTLSSHPPYDIPEDDYWAEKDDASVFVNSAHYTDKYLTLFLDSLENSPVWKNLLVIIVADHGARFPIDISYSSPEKFYIPLLYTGGVVKMDTILHRVCSQTDIVATILAQMNIDSKEFIFSNNSFRSDTSGFAFYTFNNGCGWVDSEGQRVISNDNNQVILNRGQCLYSDKFLLSYFQKLMDDFDHK
ncbi:MAG: sulfatase-like hydrolase/transferase [Saprospiraceae bacterium]